MTRRSTPWSRAGAVVTALAVALGSTAGLAEETTPAPKPFKEEQLASLLAPIALYPDAVLTQVLIATTYPLEVVQANRWVQKNTSLKGEALAAAAGKQPWDASVQSLTAVPEVLKMMDEKLDWTQKVGDAFLAQQKDVMDMVQKLRAKAKEEGNLKTDDHMKVSTEAAPATTAGTTTPATQVIVIESADPEVIYVPTYSPVTIYGSWWYPAYPPYYWPPPMGYPGSGFWWGVGIGIGVAHWGHHYSHYSCDWHGGDINIDRGDRNQINTGDRNRVNTGDRGGATNKGGGQKWSHDPSHRKGVSYRDSGSAAKYDKASRAGVGSRDAYRGRTSSGTSDFKGGGAGASAATRGTGASAGTRDLGSGAKSGASAGTRAGSSSPSGYGAAGSKGTSATSSSRGGGYSGGSGSSSAFGGMGSGSRAGSYGSRGGSSRGSWGGGGRGGGGGRRR